jgi:NAD(P)-dependent dehydrogenase (short-subunit alcohol dehydrogenase family)
MGFLDGKIAVITGAGSGMAKASVKAFVREGAKVVAADFSGAEQDTAKEVGGDVIAVHCDVTKEDDVQNAVATAVNEFGRLDCMLNVAGIAMGAPFVDIDDAHYEKQMDVDLRGVLYGIKHGVKAMLANESGGAIVNWSSLGGLGAAPYTAVYTAAKHGVVGMTKVAAIEYGPKNIRVNAVCPGFIHTEIMGSRMPPGMEEKHALNRGGQPSEVAEVAAFLCSDRASFVTGVALPVDGGWWAKLA